MQNKLLKDISTLDLFPAEHKDRRLSNFENAIEHNAHNNHSLITQIVKVT